MLSASDLYAIANSNRNHGKEECHWCGSACNDSFIHNDPPPVPFVRSRSTAKRPCAIHICTGCWLYRRQRITVRFLDGGFSDRQNPCKHSWWITLQEASGISKYNYHALYRLLLNPPLCFCLSLRTDEKTDNLIQLSVANDLEEINATTELCYTLNNIKLVYTIYELEEAIKHGPEGKMPGVRMLVETLGGYTLPLEEPVMKKTGAGRPFKNKEEPQTIKLTRKIK